MDASNKTSENSRTTMPSDKVIVGNSATLSADVEASNSAKTSDKIKENRAKLSEIFKAGNSAKPSDKDKNGNSAKPSDKDKIENSAEQSVKVEAVNCKKPSDYVEAVNTATPSYDRVQSWKNKTPSENVIQPLGGNISDKMAKPWSSVTSDGPILDETRLMHADEMISPGSSQFISSSSKEEFDPLNVRPSEEVVAPVNSESFLNIIYSNRQSSISSNEFPERESRQYSIEDPFHFRRLSSTWSEQIEFEAMEKFIIKDKKISDPSLILGQLQNAIEHSMTKLPISLGRDLLMTDFTVVDVVNFGNVEKKEHNFVFYNYAPIAFWFFRELFGISNKTFKKSMCDQPLRKRNECGGSGSIFYTTSDDRFILKTVRRSDVVFLTKLLPGYYLNFTQRVKTFLPKYYGMFCYRKGLRSVRIVVMNNLLPSKIKIQRVYDLKGSTYKRREHSKSDVKTLKDLNFRDHYPKGFYLKKKLYKVILTSLERDCHVLRSYEIMDYSLLLGVQQFTQCFLKSHDTVSCTSKAMSFTSESESTESLTSIRKEDDLMENLIGPFEARNAIGEVVFLYIGIIDILQSYGRQKKIEHCLKSLFCGSTAISVQEPKLYAQRFQEFIRECVLKYIPNLRSS